MEKLKKCSFCAEKIKDSAQKCKYCGEFLNKKNSQYIKQEQIKDGFIKRHPIITALIFLFILFFIISFMEESISENNISKQVENMSAIDKMSIAFVGNYSRKEIKDKMDKAITLSKLPLTEENYSRAASTLIGLRKEYNIEEMDILDYMTRSYVSGVNMSFPDMAAISVSALFVGAN